MSPQTHVFHIASWPPRFCALSEATCTERHAWTAAKVSTETLKADIASPTSMVSMGQNLRCGSTSIMVRFSVLKGSFHSQDFPDVR